MLRVVRAFENMLRLLMIACALCAQPSSLCALAMSHPGHAEATHCCCEAGAVDATNASDASAKACTSCASEQSSCGEHAFHCDRPCCLALAFPFQPSLAPHLDRVPLGIARDLVHRLHGILIPPQPRPPPARAA